MLITSVYCVYWSNVCYFKPDDRLRHPIWTLTWADESPFVPRSRIYKAHTIGSRSGVCASDPCFKGQLNKNIHIILKGFKINEYKIMF